MNSTNPLTKSTASNNALHRRSWKHLRGRHDDERGRGAQRVVERQVHKVVLGNGGRETHTERLRTLAVAHGWKRQQASFLRSEERAGSLAELAQIASERIKQAFG